jgi:hypothetical protein
MFCRTLHRRRRPTSGVRAAQVDLQFRSAAFRRLSTSAAVSCAMNSAHGTDDDPDIMVCRVLTTPEPFVKNYFKSVRQPATLLSFSSYVLFRTSNTAEPLPA